VAYHLAKAGVRTLLVEQGDLASGASGANFGRIQIQDSEFGFSLELSLRSFVRHRTLEEELAFDLDYRTSGYLLLIENQNQWAVMEKRAQALQEAGIGVQLLDREEVCRLEPHIAPETVIGALYHPHEAELNPFSLVYAFALRGRDHGLEVWPHTSVTRLEVQGNRVTGVQTQDRRLSAGSVVLACGAWTRGLGLTAGLDIPLPWVHGEAVITEQLPPVVHNAMLTASFFEETEGAEGQTVAFCLCQRPEGNTILGEAAFVSDRLSRRMTPTAIPAIVAEARRRFPSLNRARILRGWAIPVTFTPDNRPLLGPVPGLEGLFIAAGLKSTIILTPIVGELVADMITGREVDPRLSEFEPLRTYAHDRGNGA
jgi:sarcosine oxidase subunit beta